MCTIFIVYEHLDFFQVFAIIKYGTINISAYVSSCTWTQIPLGYIFRSRIPDSYGMSILDLLDYARRAHTNLYSISIKWGSLLVHIKPTQCFPCSHFSEVWENDKDCIPSFFHVFHHYIYSILAFWVLWIQRWKW